MRTPLHHRLTDAAIESRTMTSAAATMEQRLDDDAEFVRMRRRRIRRRPEEGRASGSRLALLLLLAVAGLYPAAGAAEVATTGSMGLGDGKMRPFSTPDRHRGRRRRKLDEERRSLSSRGRTRLHHRAVSTDDELGLGTAATLSDAPRLDDSSASASLPPYQLTTSFDGDKRGYGNMFDVVAAAAAPANGPSHASLSIFGLDLHVDLINDDIPVRVYVTPGTFVGKENSPDEWEVIFDSSVRGGGSGVPTPLPTDEFSRDVTLAPGETMGFYVTLVESAHMLYTSMTSSNVSAYAPPIMAADAMRVDTVGDYGDNSTSPSPETRTAWNSSRTSTTGPMRDGNMVVASNTGHLSVLSGLGVRHPFGESFAGRDWNGVIRYRLNPSLSDAILYGPPPPVHRLDTREFMPAGDEGEGGGGGGWESAVNGIVFEVVVNVPPSSNLGDENTTVATSGPALTIHGMELRTQQSSSEGDGGGWARVEVYTLAGSYRDDAAPPGWTRIADEYVQLSSSSTTGGTTPLSPFVNPVQITMPMPPSSSGGIGEGDDEEGDDDKNGGIITQSFYVTMSSPDMLSVSTDDPIGASSILVSGGGGGDDPSSNSNTSGILDVLVGMAVTEQPPIPPSSFFDSINGAEVGGGEGLLFEGVILYSLTGADADTDTPTELEKVQAPTLTPTPPRPTPSPTVAGTSFPTPSYLLSTYTSGPRLLTTGYEYPNERFSHGNVFDITTKVPLVITSLSFHSNFRLSNETYTVRVYSKPGSYRTGAADAQLWTRVADVDFRGGRGEGVGTMIPTGQFRNVEIEAGETRAFIVLLSHPNIIYSAYSGPQVGRPGEGDDGLGDGDEGSGATVSRDDIAYAGNDDLDILVGGGIGRYEFNVWSERHFDELFADRIWHGTVHYRSSANAEDDVVPPRPGPSAPSPSSPDLRPSTEDDVSGSTLPPTPSEVLTHRTGREILSTLSGGSTGAGCMFDIRASRRSGSVVVRSLDVLTVAVSGDGDEVAAVARLLDGIALYSRDGSYVSHVSDPDAWTQRTVTSSIPGREAQEMRGEYLVKIDLDVPLVVTAGDVVGLYVSLSTSDLIYTEVLTQGEGDVYTSNENVSLMVGIGMQPTTTENEEGGVDLQAFGDDYETAPAVFNGIVYYSVLTPRPTMRPTPSPTMTPLAPDGTRPVVSQQSIRLVGISRRRLLEVLQTRRLASSPVLGDENVVAFFEETVRTFLNDWIRRSNPTLEVRDVIVSTDVVSDDVQHPITEKDAVVRRESTRRHKDTDEFFGSLRWRSLRGGRSFPPPRGVARLLQRPAAPAAETSSEPSFLDVYTTISAGFIPPPEVDFNRVVQDTFDERGDAFVRKLNEEPAFAEVTGVEARTVSFPLPPLPPYGSDVDSSGAGTGAGGGLGPGIIAGLVVAAVASLILMGGFVYLFVMKKKKERLRQDLLEGSARLRNASATDYPTGQGVAAGNPEWEDDDSEYGRRNITDDDEKKKKKAYARGASHSSPGAYISYSGGMDCKDDGSIADDESEAKAKGRKHRSGVAAASAHHMPAPGDDVRVYNQEVMMPLNTAQEVHGEVDRDDSDGAKKPRALPSLSPKTKALSPRRRKSRTKTSTSPARASAPTPLESTEESSDSDVVLASQAPTQARTPRSSPKRTFGKIKGFGGSGKKSSPPKPPSPPPTPPRSPSPDPVRAMRRLSELSSSEANTTTDTGGGNSSSTTYTDVTTTDGGTTGDDTSDSGNESDNSKVRFSYPLVTEVRTRPRTSPEEVINLFHSPPMKKKRRRKKKKKDKDKEKKDKKKSRRDSNESASSSGDSSSVATSDSSSDGKGDGDEDDSSVGDAAAAKDQSAVSDTSRGGDVFEDEDGARSGADLNITSSSDGAPIGIDTTMGKSDDSVSS